MSETAAAHVIGAGGLKLRSARHMEDHYIDVSGELDIASAEALDAEVARVEATDANRIVVDLAGLDFMDSTGLHVLLALNTRSQDNGHRLRLRRPSPAVDRVLQITRADRMLPFID